MKKAALVIVLVSAMAVPVFAKDSVRMGLALGVGANRDLMDAGFTAVDVSIGAGLSFFPIWIDDFAAGVTIRATGGSSIVDDATFIGWYALTPLLTIGFFDNSPMSISVGYGPYAYADVPSIYLYSPAVLLDFDLDASVLEIGMIGPSVFIGFGFSF
jgi:hypothetical protein